MNEGMNWIDCRHCGLVVRDRSHDDDTPLVNLRCSGLVVSSTFASRLATRLGVYPRRMMEEIALAAEYVALLVGKERLCAPEASIVLPPPDLSRGYAAMFTADKQREAEIAREEATTDD